MQAFIGDFVPAGNVDFTNNLYMKIYFSGCDFKCPFCNTPEMIENNSEQEIDLRELIKEMSNQAGTIKGVMVTGGEPCFQKQALLQLLQKAKELGLKTAIDTNGSKPEVIEKLLKEELLDIVLMDVKAPFNTTFDKVTRSSTWFKQSKDIMSEVRQTLQILRSYDEKTDIIFRTTIVPGLISRKEELKEIANEIAEINSVWELRPFRNDNVKEKPYQRIERPSQEYIDNIKKLLLKDIPKLRFS